VIGRLELRAALTGTSGVFYHVDLSGDIVRQGNLRSRGESRTLSGVAAGTAAPLAYRPRRRPSDWL